MKTMLPLVLVLLLSAGCGSTRQNGNGTQSNTTAALVNNNNFLFRAQTATPLNGRIINLTFEYEVKVSKDTIVAFLPYFGRAFTAPMDPSQGGIKFTSTKFSQKLQQRRRGGWELVVKPEDVPDIQILNFTITTNGYTTLQVTSTNKQPISFYGTIEANTLKNNR
ncbi:DUF4251 domain-containing protein [Filimonas effusa]|uniref:DUF4251 domain-containing protein n=1 Tax=Filimonas effusa TaxID=2508721 RepID=A0A4Q1D972_9BACT|nr:DUF4251 domain-containing protein [Filimonas effusa]RXK85917.1 DUF4251 domain-containing protein [Filimonas effusa]